MIKKKKGNKTSRVKEKLRRCVDRIKGVKKTMKTSNTRPTPKSISHKKPTKISASHINKRNPIINK